MGYFADDTRISRFISDENDAAKLQDDLVTLEEWAEQNNMALNGTKFQCLKYGHIESLKDNYDYVAGDLEAMIEEPDNTRDLGIIMSSNGHFNDHCNHIIKKAKKKIGWIHRSFFKNDRSFLKKMWKTYIQS